MGEPYRSARTKEPVCTFTAPLLDPAGRLLGMVGCSVKLLGKEALGMLRVQPLGSTGYLYIIDQTRLMIMHPQDSRVLRRDAPLGPICSLKMPSRASRGWGRPSTPGGIPMLVAFKRVPQTNWIVAAQQPRAEAWPP